MSQINILNCPDQLNDLIKGSWDQPFALFKHSTRCSISSMALNRLWPQISDASNLSFVLLDLLKNRELSSHIAELTQVQHESPQVLVFSKGEVVFHASHNSIDLASVEASLRP